MHGYLNQKLVARIKNIFKGRPLFWMPSQKKMSPIYWFILSVVIITLDYFTGPYLRLQILYIIPVFLASWFSGRRWGLVLSCGLPLVRIIFRFLWAIPWGIGETISNAVIYIIIFSLLVFLIGHEKQRQSLLKEVRILRGLLPICSFCKRIRNRDNNWEPLENYIAEHSEAEFSHGFCPECAKEHYGVSLSPKE
jgi:hypothetical protein